ncbi:hypothetical protein [Larkinella rosea]|uniref:IS110 family transposase n=1 Tax=Larkinella rosea TaxID=2025312 RepID=A0A3P1BZH4_9BACT|nr:hypothetical protein [Larkinella rosea]RRB06402.1 hypothetical protein EHT25_00945 [Larkinella rosea]
MSATRAKGELQDWYRRKVAEGKDSGAARADAGSYVRNNGTAHAVIHRIYAVIRRGEKYDKNYALSLA